MILEVACSASVDLSLIPIILNSFFIFGSLSRSVDLMLTLNYQMHHPNTTYVIHWHIWLFSPFLIHFSLFFIIFNLHTEREKKHIEKKERETKSVRSLYLLNKGLYGPIGTQTTGDTIRKNLCPISATKI